MYDIYIKNYTDSTGNFISDENLLYSIPFDEEDPNILIEPIVKTEMGKTGSFEFSVYPNHPYFNAWHQMKTIMRVVYDGDTLFRGRVLTIDNSPMTGARKIHLEGDMAFLMDSQQEGVKDGERTEQTLSSYLQQIMNNHNNQMDADGEYEKKIFLGEVPGQYSSSIHKAQKIPGDKTEKFGSSGWKSTMDALNELPKQYGGYFRTRSEEETTNGVTHIVTYLDWLNDSFRYTLNGQAIRLSENLINITDQMEVDNLFTALIPIGSSKGNNIYVEGYREDVHGHNKRILVSQIVGLFPDSDLNVGYHSKSDYEHSVEQYGIIYKAQSFSNASTQEELWSEATEWIKDNYFGGINTFNLSALDMHHLNIVVQKYLTGDRVQVIYPDMYILSNSNSERPLVEKILTFTSIQYNLHNPDKNAYTIGKPSMLVNKKYGSSNSKKSSSQAANSDMTHNDTDTEHSIELQALQQEAWNYVVNAKYNSEEYQELMTRDPTGKTADLALHGSYIGLVEGFLAGESHPTSGEHKRRLQNIMLNGVTASVEIAGPVDRSRVTEEDVPVINSMNRTMIFDGLGQRFGLKTALDLSIPDYRDVPPKTRLEMRLNSGTNKTQIVTYKPGKEPESLLPTEITSLLDGSTGTMNTVMNVLGLDGSGEKGTIVQDGSASMLQFFTPSSAQSPTPDLTSSLDGSTGTVNAMKNVLGLDGTGQKGTIVQDGATSLLRLFTPSSAQSGTPNETVQMDGTNGVTKVGKDSSQNWQVELNKEVTYQDADGIWHTAKGFVGAKDFNVPEIDSFKTKIGIFDIVIASKVSATTIAADLAEVRKWLGDRISADTYIQTYTLYANTVYSSGNITLNGRGTGHYEYRLADASLRYVDSCLYGVSKTERDGEVTLTFSRLNGAPAASVTFSVSQ